MCNSDIILKKPMGKSIGFFNICLAKYYGVTEDATAALGSGTVVGTVDAAVPAAAAAAAASPVGAAIPAVAFRCCNSNSSCCMIACAFGCAKNVASCGQCCVTVTVLPAASVVVAAVAFDVVPEPDWSAAGSGGINSHTPCTLNGQRSVAGSPLY